MLSKGNLICGLFNFKINNEYKRCTTIADQFIPLDDIINYKVELFKNASKKDTKNIIENIDIMEALSSDTLLFTNNKFLDLLKDYDEIFINQKILATLISNDKSRFEIKYMEGLYLKDKFIPIYLTPIDNLNTYLIKKSDNKMESYVRLKYFM
jgi:hypothetical protein